MSFQSQLLGATRAVTGLMAKDDPELERQFTNSQNREIQKTNELKDELGQIYDLRKDILKSNIEDTRREINDITSNSGKEMVMTGVDEKGEPIYEPELSDDVVTLAGHKSSDLGNILKDQLKQLNDLNKINIKKQNLKENKNMSIDDAVRRGYIQASAIEPKNEDEKESDKSKDFVSDMFKQSTEYINAQTALEKQRLLRRRRNGNDKSN